MATIIVDYENVHEAGLHGIEELRENDKLVIFYSECCGLITQENVEYIRDSMCEFDVVKLKYPRHNALDMYQAVYVGRLVERGEREIALVTKDKGFNSIKDYLSQSNPDVHIYLANDIQVALAQFKDDAERSEIIKQKMMRVSLEVGCISISKDKESKNKIAQALINSGLDSVGIDNVYSFFGYVKEKGRKKIYTSALHTFGRERGTKIYGLIKDVI